MGYERSLSKCWYQRASHIPCVTAIYSASVLERTALDYFHEVQPTGAPHRIQRDPETDLRSTGSLAQSESVYPWSTAGFDPSNVRLASLLLTRYQYTLLRAERCSSPGVAACRLRYPTAKARSGRVPIIAYITDPSMD